MPDRPPPFVATSEVEILVGFLQYLRESVILKLEAVRDDLASTAGVSSGTSLLSLVQHLVGVEVEWFEFLFLGRDPQDVPPPDTSSMTEADWIALYRKRAARSDEVVASAPSLDEPLKAIPQLNLRWMLVHMIEETARHAGHADILREQLDGITGR